ELETQRSLTRWNPVATRDLRRSGRPPGLQQEFASPSPATRSGQSQPTGELRGKSPGRPAQEGAAAMNQHHGNRGPQSGDRQQAERSLFQLLTDAALWKQRQTEVRLDHALLCREAVDWDDVRRGNADGCESL